MKELDDFEKAFFEFDQNMYNFSSHINKAKYKDEDVKLLVFQTCNKLQDLYIDVYEELKRLKQLKNF